MLEKLIIEYLTKITTNNKDIRIKPIVGKGLWLIEDYVKTKKTIYVRNVYTAYLVEGFRRDSNCK